MASASLEARWPPSRGFEGRGPQPSASNWVDCEAATREADGQGKSRSWSPNGCWLGRAQQRTAAARQAYTWLVQGLAAVPCCAVAMRPAVSQAQPWLRYQPAVPHLRARDAHHAGRRLLAQQQRSAGQVHVLLAVA